MEGEARLPTIRESTGGGGWGVVAQVGSVGLPPGLPLQGVRIPVARIAGPYRDERLSV